jgi:hypothetical protein
MTRKRDEKKNDTQIKRIKGSRSDMTRKRDESAILARMTRKRDERLFSFHFILVSPHVAKTVPIEFGMAFAFSRAFPFLVQEKFFSSSFHHFIS